MTNELRSALACYTDMNRLAFFPVLVLLPAVAGCPSSAPRPAAATSASTDAVHDRSGFRFPSNVGPFVRTLFEMNDDKGDDVTAGYRLLTGQLQVIATAYVYPAPVDVKVFPLPSVGEAPDWFVKNHFQRVQAEIIHHHKGAVLVAEDRVQLRQAGRLHSGWHCEYAFSEPFILAGLPQPLRSEAYVFTHGAWFVKYRFTYPEPQAAAAREAITAFMSDLNWSGTK